MISRRGFLKSLAAVAGAFGVGGRVAAESSRSVAPAAPQEHVTTLAGVDNTTIRLIGSRWRDMGFTDTRDAGFTLTGEWSVPFHVPSDARKTVEMWNVETGEVRVFLPQVQSD
jgi:anaerobic selenocysteine-containing dehydrogenase